MTRLTTSFVHRYAIVTTWICLIAGGTGFFLPWAQLSVPEVSGVRELLGRHGMSEDVRRFAGGTDQIRVEIQQGEERIGIDLTALASLPHTIRGIDIPRLAQQDQVRTALAVAAMLTGRNQPMGWKSYGVYLVPGLLLVLGGVLLRSGTRVLHGLGLPLHQLIGQQ